LLRAFPDGDGDGCLEMELELRALENSGLLDLGTELEADGRLL
jgi:hypothetical protein